MFSMSDIAQLESTYNVSIVSDSVGTLTVRGTAEALKQSRHRIRDIVPVGIGVNFVEVALAGQGVRETVDKPLDFNGLWRSGKDEPKCLLRVFKWQMGKSYEHDYDKLRITAEVVRAKEGDRYPRILELMMPTKSGMVLEVETYWYVASKQPETGFPIVELSGKIYGPLPLLREHWKKPEPDRVEWDKKLYDTKQPPSTIIPRIPSMDEIKDSIMKKLASHTPLGPPYDSKLPLLSDILCDMDKLK